MFSYEAFSEATMLADDFSTSGLAEDWFESECNVFNSFAAWTSESLDSIKWQVAVLLWTTGIHNNKWLVWGVGDIILNIQQIWKHDKCFHENTGMFI